MAARKTKEKKASVGNGAALGARLGSVAAANCARILRGGKSIGWWERGASKLKAGDRIIEVIPDHLFPRVPTV